MSWRQDLRIPSFRGVRFNLWNTEREGGRNNITHEFIQRDPYTEDTSRVPRRFSFDAFISGFDYFRQRDRLITALETPGPGPLVHPYYGTLQVNVVRYRIRESGLEGGIVRFSLDFVEAGQLSFPSVVVQKGGIFSDIASKISDTSIAKFVSSFDIVGKAQFVIDAAQSKITELTNDLNAATSFITAKADQISDLAVSITDLERDALTLINTPAVLAARMVAAIDAVSNSVFDPRESLDAYNHIIDYGNQDPVLTLQTEQRIAEDTNNKAFTNLVRTMALKGAVGSAAQVSFESEEDAQVERENLYDQIDALMESVSDDAVFAELNNLRTFVSLNIPPPDEDLPRIFQYQNPSTMPSIVLSYQFFGDVLSENDIVKRNGVSNPNYVPGGEQLRILGRV